MNRALTPAVYRQASDLTGMKNVGMKANLLYECKAILRQNREVSSPFCTFCDKSVGDEWYLPLMSGFMGMDYLDLEMR